jgi:hypothetical protein
MLNKMMELWIQKEKPTFRYLFIITDYALQFQQYHLSKALLKRPQQKTKDIL